MIDIGSSINLITLEVFNKLGLDKNNCTKVSYSLMGLGDKIMAVMGTINLPFVLGDEKHKWELYVEFAMVVSYNVILGRLVINCHGIVINMGDMYLKLAP